MTSGDGNDKIDGRDNEDEIYGGTGNDAISAGSGHDYVSGGDGNDVIAGGKGNDELYGEEGSDVYVFNRGDGNDEVNNWQGNSSGDVDTMSFGVDVTPDDITAYVDTNGSLVMSVKGGNDTISIGWFDSQNGYAEYPDHGLSRVQFVDKNGDIRIFDLKGIVSALRDSIIAADAANPTPLFTNATSGFELTGTVAAAGGDYAVAYAQTGDLFAQPAYYTGGAGNDVINGRAGDDEIDAGNGDNLVNAGDGNNNVYAGDGNDRITTGSGNDAINGGEGDNVINAGAGNDEVITGSGDDVIDAGAGDDVIGGGGGSDTLIGGNGNDTYVYDLGDGVVTINDLALQGEGNRIIFGEGITPDDLKLKLDEQGVLRIDVGAEGDAIRLNNFDPEDAYGKHAIETYEFADGTILTYQDIINKGFDITGTLTDDQISGTSADDRITALGGDDIIAAGKGNDIIDGGSGNDTYVFNIGDGVDTIRDATALGAGNVIEFGLGITASDLQLEVRESTLIINIGQNGDAIKFEGFNTEEPLSAYPVETFRFADGTQLSYQDILNLGIQFNGTDNDDTLKGTAAADVFRAGKGNDQIMGGTGRRHILLQPGRRDRHHCRRRDTA